MLTMIHARRTDIEATDLLTIITRTIAVAIGSIGDRRARATLTRPLFLISLARRAAVDMDVKWQTEV